MVKTSEKKVPKKDPAKDKLKSPSWEKTGTFDKQEFKKEFGPLVDKVDHAINSLPKAIKSKFSYAEVLSIIKETYLAGKQNFKAGKDGTLTEDQKQKLNIINIFEKNLNLEPQETSGLVISAIEYIESNNDTIATKGMKEVLKISNVSLDKKTGKLSASHQQKDIAEISHEALNEGRVYSELLIKIAAPKKIKDNLAKLWDVFLKSKDTPEEASKKKAFYKAYNKYTLALEKVLKGFYEKDPKFTDKLEEELFKNLRKISTDKSSLAQLLNEYKKNQPDEYFKNKIDPMSKELENTFFLNDIFMKAYKYLKTKNDVREEYLKSKEIEIGDYNLVEFDDGKRPREPFLPEKPDPEPIQPEPIKPEPIKPEPPKKVIDKLKIRTAFIAYSDQLVKEYAREMADRKMSNDYKPERSKSFFGRIGNFFQRVWKYGTFREYYRQKNVSKFKQDIYSNKNLFVDEDLTSTTQNNLNGAIIDRLINIDDLNQAIHTGEKVRLLEDPEIKKEIVKSIKSYAAGKMTQTEFLDFQNHLSAQIKIANPDIFEDTVIDANNLLETAKSIKLQAGHEIGLRDIDIDIDIVIGNMKAGVRSQQKLNVLDRCIDRVQQTRFGSLVNENTLSSSLAIFQGIGNTLGSLFLFNKAAQIGSLGGTAAIGGLLSGIRARNQWEQKRQQHFRDLASGRKLNPEDKQRSLLEKYRYQTIIAPVVIKYFDENLSALSGKEKLKQEEISTLINDLALINASIELSDEKSIDLVTYSNPQLIDRERTQLDIKRAQLENILQQTCETQSIDFGHQPFEEYFKDCVSANKKKLLEDDKGINEKDAQFRGFKNKQGLKAFGLGAARAVAFGFAFQEIGAIMNPHQQGAIESLWHQDLNPTSQTLIKQWTDHIVGRFNGIADGACTIQDNLPLGQRPELINISKTQELVLDPKGNYDLWSGGRLQCNDIITFHGDKMEFDPEVLKANGFFFNESSANVASSGTSRVMLNSRDYVNNNPAMVSAHRGEWLRNNTPGVYKLNEGALDHYVGVDGNDIVIDVSRMTPKGSFNGDFSISPIEAIKQGNLKLWVSQSAHTSGKVFEIPFESSKIVINETSPLRQLFHIHNGQVEFNGGVIEVVAKKGDIGDILASATGNDTAENILVNVSQTVPEVVSKLNLTAIPTTTIPTVFPIPVFINQGTPLTRSEKLPNSISSPIPVYAKVKFKEVPSPNDVQYSPIIETTKEQMLAEERMEARQAGYELAQIARDKGITLANYTREDYVLFAIENSKIISREQLAGASYLRDAVSEQEFITIRNRTIASVEASQSDKDFKKFSNSAQGIAKRKDLKDRVIIDKVYAIPEKKSDGEKSYMHFQLNNGVDSSLNQLYKGYLTFDHLENFSIQNFVRFLEELATGNNFNINVKIFKDLAQQGSILNDQIVIHANTQEEISKIFEIAKEVFKDNPPSTCVGLDHKIDNEWISYSTKLAQDIKTAVENK